MTAAGPPPERRPEGICLCSLLRNCPCAPASLNKQRQELHLALNMWLWGCFLETDLGPRLAGQFSSAPRDRKLLPSACGAGSPSVRAWAGPPPPPTAPFRAAVVGGRPPNPTRLSPLAGSLCRHRHPRSTEQTSRPPGPCLGSDNKDTPSPVLPTDPPTHRGKGLASTQVRVPSRSPSSLGGLPGRPLARVQVGIPRAGLCPGREAGFGARVRTRVEKAKAP